MKQQGWQSLRHFHTLFSTGDTCIQHQLWTVWQAPIGAELLIKLLIEYEDHMLVRLAAEVLYCVHTALCAGVCWLKIAQNLWEEGAHFHPEILIAKMINWGWCHYTRVYPSYTVKLLFFNVKELCELLHTFCNTVVKHGSVPRVRVLWCKSSQLKSKLNN